MPAGILAVAGIMPARSKNGRAVTARIRVYENKTTMPVPVFADATLTAELLQPIESDAAGRFPLIYRSDALPAVTMAWQTDDGQTLTVDDLLPSMNADTSIADDAQAALELMEELVGAPTQLYEARDEAVAAAGAANTSAGKAAGSATNAAGSAGAAAGSAAAAAGSAGAAAGSATTAGNARDAAVEAQGLAEDARDAAATSAGQAAGSAGTASGFATAAGNARDATVTAKGEAEQARDAAQTARTGAEQAETDAQAAAALAASNVRRFSRVANSSSGSNPGSGNFRFVADPVAGSPFTFRISNVDRAGNSLSAWFDTWDDSTSPTKGTLTFQSLTGLVQMAVTTVVNGGHFRVDGTVISAQGDFLVGQDFLVDYSVTGNAGADGAGTGDVTGPAGAVNDQLLAVFNGTSGKAIKGATNVWSTSGGLRIEGTQPQIIIKETDQTLPAGLHRVVADNGGVQVQRNTAAAGDFSTNNIVIDIAFDGRVGFSNIVSITSGAPEFRFGESDQTDPTGRYRFQVDGGTFRMQRATSANWASAATFLNCDSSGAVNVYGTYIGLNNNASMLGGAMLTLSGDPTAALHAATKQYVDNLVSGLDVKQSVRCATTGNLAALSGLLTVDGVTVVAGDRVLVKNQTTQSQNGIYIAAAGAWARAADMDSWEEVPGASVWVEAGTSNDDRAWVCTSNQGGTLGTTAITWSQFGGTGAFQGVNANLTAISGLGALSANVLSFLGGADYAALRGQLSLTAATAAEIWTGTDTTKPVTSAGLRAAVAYQALTDAATITWARATNGVKGKVTLTANRIVGLPTGFADGEEGCLEITPATFTPSFAAGWNFGSSGPPSLNTAAGKRNKIYFEWNAAAGQAVVTGFWKDA